MPSKKLTTIEVMKNARKETSSQSEIFKTVLLSTLKPSKYNPREVFAPQALEDLAQSIRTQGIIDPLIVRKNGDGFEIVAGERRFRAAKKAGLTRVPVLVRDMTDQQVMEIQVIENIQRENLSTLEECRGFRTMIDEGNYEPKTIAEKIGKSLRYVYNRLELEHLSDRSRKALQEETISTSHAELLSRLTPPLQSRILTRHLQSRDGLNVRDMKNWIGREIFKSLSAAPWKWDDAELLPKAGACDVCPKLARNMPSLPEGAKKETCTDSGCYEAKMQAWGEHKLKDLAAKKEKAVLISTEYSRHMGPDWNAPKGLLWEENYRNAGKKTCKSTVTGICIHGSIAGKTKKLCIAKGACPTHSGYAAPALTEKNPTQKAAEKRERDKKAVQEEARKRALQLAIEKTTWPPTPTQMREVAKLLFRRTWNNHQKEIIRFMGWDPKEARQKGGYGYDYEKFASIKIDIMKPPKVAVFLNILRGVPHLGTPDGIDGSDGLQDLAREHRIDLERLAAQVRIERQRRERQKKKTSAMSK